MATGSIDATQGIASTITKRIPFTGTWFYPNSGVDQIIFPDFYDKDPNVQTASNEIYWPSAQLADLYTAWSPQRIDGAPFKTTISDTNDVNFRLTNALQDSTEGHSSIEVHGQVAGFTDILQGIYGGIVYSPDAETQTLINNGKGVADKLYEDLAGQVRDAYSNNSAFKPSGEKYFGTSDKPTLNSGAVQSSLQQMALVIANHPEQILNQSTDVYDNYLLAKGSGQDALTNFQNKLASSLIQGTLDWQSTFNSGFGKLDPMGIDYEFSMPWNGALYTQYKQTIGDPRIVAWSNAVTTQQSAQAQLIRSVNYLADLKTKNSSITPSNPSGNFTTTSTSFFDPVAKYSELPGALPYTARYSTSPISGGGEGSSVSFNISTANSTSETATTSDKSQWNANSTTDVKGWFYSAKASVSTGGFTKNKFSDMKSNATNMNGVFTWDGMKSKEVNPSSLWFYPTALTQAWNQSHTTNSHNYSGGFGFTSVKKANQYITSEIYRLSSIAHGTPSSVVKGQTETKDLMTKDNFKKTYSNASASGGVGWGPFSFGASTSYSNENQTETKSLDFSQTDSNFTVTNNPLLGVTFDPTKVGTPSAILGFTVSSIGSARGSILQDDSSSSRNKGKGGKGLFTITAADDAKKRHSHDLAGGNDTHYAGSGKSIVDGGNGRDILAGLDGSDILSGGNGNDTIYPGKGRRNQVYLGKGADFIAFERDDLGFTTVKDFAEVDSLSFTGYSSSDLRFEGRVLYADDVKIAKFQGKGVTEFLENAIEEAHYSLPADFMTAAQIV
jgi:hypothetical protein